MTSILSLVKGPFEITLDLSFDNSMWCDVSLTSAANYVFNNGAYVYKVDQLSVDGSRLRLWVEKFYGHDSFVLVISSNVRDSSEIPLVGNSISINLDISSAHFSSYNGLIKTSSDINFIASDSQRYYLASTKGIDIIKKNIGVPTSWAYLLDGYNITSMYVANYPSDLVISGTVVPYFVNRNPDSGGIAYPDTDIYFEVAGVSAALDMATLNIYVDDVHIFDGIGGWLGGFSGDIIFSYKSLLVTIYSPGNFIVGATVVVRGIISDLLNNEMDSSYGFSIESFGTGVFGLSFFGIYPFAPVSGE